jgi:PAS domain S-box-containing protein
MDDQEYILNALKRSAGETSGKSEANPTCPSVKTGERSSTEDDVKTQFVLKSKAPVKSDEDKTREELIAELQELRREVDNNKRRSNSPVLSTERADAKRLQDMFQLIIDTIPVSIWWKDKDSRFLGCNMKLAEDAGFRSPAEMIGKTDYDCPWKQEESDWFVEWDRKVMEENTPQRHIIEPKLNADGKQAWLDTTKVPLHDYDGNVIGTLGTYEDITERKQAELELTRAHEQLASTHAELQAAHALLEERVRERTQALEETNAQLHELSEELIRARDQAMEASKYKSNFLANMSHEIRTPLNSVVAVTELLLKTTLDSEQQEFADIIQSSSRALLEIVQDILDFSKIEAGRAELNIEEFDLRSVTESVRDVLGSKADEKHLVFSTRILGQLPVPIKGDAPRIKQILLNLVGNAIKFTSQGRIELLIESTPKEHGRCELKFSVSDTGIGFVEGTAEKLFEPFMQADGSITRRFGGTGLGLSICRELVQLMGGEIGVTSTEGSGSRFWFDITVDHTPDAVMIDPLRNDDWQNGDWQSPSSLRRLPLTDAGKGLVLIADDSPLNRKVTLLVMQHLGLDAEAVCNGEEAIDAMSKRKYDLVLMDCQMPVLDGFEATRRIRDLEKSSGSRIPIVALTAQAIDGDREKCLDSGMDDYITKPITPARLATVLGRWLSHELVRTSE